MKISNIYHILCEISVLHVIKELYLSLEKKNVNCTEEREVELWNTSVIILSSSHTFNPEEENS